MNVMMPTAIKAVDHRNWPRSEEDLASAALIAQKYNGCDLCAVILEEFAARHQIMPRNGSM